MAEPVLQLWLLDTEAASMSVTGAAWAGAGAQMTGLGWGGRGIAERHPAENRDCLQRHHMCRGVIMNLN